MESKSNREIAVEKGPVALGHTTPAVLVCRNCSIEVVNEGEALGPICDRILKISEQCSVEPVWDIIGRIAIVLGLLAVTVLGFAAAARVGQ